MKLRIATFNMENLFARFDFSAFAETEGRKYLPPVVNMFADFDGLDQTTFAEFKTLLSAAKVAQDDDKRQQAALALAEADADIVCLQEVDNVEALMRFRDLYLHKTSARRYEQVVLHEGNDSRGIDVAALVGADVPVVSRSHAWMSVGDLGSERELAALGGRYRDAAGLLRFEDQTIFKRDCLELELRVPGHDLTVFVCHFKSMGGGKERTRGLRQLEALGVRQIIERKFDDPAQAMWMVAGDLNDYRQFVEVSPGQVRGGAPTETERRPEGGESSGLDPLLDDGFSVNLVERRDRFDQWTHYYAPERIKSQLDYLLASPALASSFSDAPEIIRGGQPFRVPNTDHIARFPRIGWDRPKASDHCPVVVELEIGG